MGCSPKGANDRRKNQYAKILGMDAVTKRIAEHAEKLGVSGLMSEADEKFGIIPVGDFMETVDLEQPHMWLSTHMEMAEARLAYVVTKLIKTKPEAIADCKTIAYEEGAKNAVADFPFIEDAGQFYKQNVLDGMPCDETMEYINMTTDELAWRKTVDNHGTFWAQAGGSVDTYYDLLDSYVKGLFSESSIRFSEENHEVFHLKK